MKKYDINICFPQLGIPSDVGFALFKERLMYTDHRPSHHPSGCPSKVMVLETSDFPCDIDETVQELAASSATVDPDPDAAKGALIYWYVNETDPRRVWDCTERALRSQLARWNKNPASFPVPEDRRVRD